MGQVADGTGCSGRDLINILVIVGQENKWIAYNGKERIDELVTS